MKKSTGTSWKHLFLSSSFYNYFFEYFTTPKDFFLKNTLFNSAEKKDAGISRNGHTVAKVVKYCRICLTDGCYKFATTAPRTKTFRFSSCWVQILFSVTLYAKSFILYPSSKFVFSKRSNNLLEKNEPLLVP